MCMTNLLSRFLHPITIAPSRERGGDSQRFYLCNLKLVARCQQHSFSHIIREVMLNSLRYCNRYYQR